MFESIMYFGGGRVTSLTKLRVKSALTFKNLEFLWYVIYFIVGHLVHYDELLLLFLRIAFFIALHDV